MDIVKKSHPSFNWLKQQTVTLRPFRTVLQEISAFFFPFCSRSYGKDNLIPLYLDF